MKSKVLTLILLIQCFSISAWAINYTLETPSPDGRFALRLDPLGVEDDSEMSAAIVNRPTNATLAKLPNTQLRNYGESRLVWAADSKRVAFTGGGKSQSSTHAFFRNGTGFREIKLPTLPKPAFKLGTANHTAPAGLYSDFISPVRWLKSGALLISRDMTMRRESNTYEGKLLVEVAFDKRHRATIRQVKRSKIVADLF